MGMVGEECPGLANDAGFGEAFVHPVEKVFAILIVQKYL
jgi:hypothetical protein